MEVVHLDQDLQLVLHVPLLPSLGREDGEQAVGGVARLGEGGRHGARRRSGPGDGVQQVALFQLILPGRFLTQLGTESVVVVESRQVASEQGGMQPAVEQVERGVGAAAQVLQERDDGNAQMTDRERQLLTLNMRK